MTWAPPELAKKWAKEGNELGVVWNGEFGWHDIKGTDISKWLEKNQEYKDVFVQNLDDFTTFMRKYPVYDGAWHVFPTKPIQVPNYKNLSPMSDIGEEKNYDCRMNDDLQYCDPILPGHNIIYRLWRILLSQVGAPTFERKIKSIEKFSSKSELLRAHPEIVITPSFYLSKWKQRAYKIFGNIIFPDSKSYTLIWFEKK